MLSQTALNDPLTPFVGELRRRVSAAVLDLVASTRPRAVDFRVHPAGLDARIVTDGGSLGLELRRPPVSDPKAWQLDGGSLRVRPPRGVSFAGNAGLQLALGALLRSRDAGTLALQGALDAADAYRPYSEIKDDFYRNLEVTTGGSGAMLRLGFRCNQDCAFCWQARDWPAPPEELYWKWLDEIGEAGVEWITLSGGEPTLYRRLPELVERAHRVHGLRVTMQSNAVQFAKAGYAQRLSDAGLEVMLVSLHAADATLSDAMTRAPGTHQRTVAGARAALEAGIQLGFNCLVERENVAQLPELAEYIVAEFVTPFPGAVLTVNFSQAGDYYDPRRLDEHYVSLESVRQPLATAARVLLAAGVSVESGGTCGFPACVFHGEEDLLPPPRAERDALHMSARTTDAVACASCARRGECVGVRKAYLARFGEAGLRPFAELEGAHNPATVSR